MIDDQFGKHGICFDEGMSGNCGLGCRGLISRECEAYEEIKEETLLQKYGELGLKVLRAQSKYEFDEDEIFQNLLG